MRSATFNKLVDLEEAIHVIAEKTGRSAMNIIEAADIKSPSALLDEAMRHWDAMLDSSNLPSEHELIERLQRDFQIMVEHTNKPFVPTDEPEAKPDSQPGEKKEAGEDANRVSLALETLLRMKVNDEAITLDDLEVFVSKVPEHTWRKRPYWVIALKDNKIAVLLNNQHGNRTFVLSYKNRPDLDRLTALTKEQLKEAGDKGAIIHHFIYEDPGQFKSDLAAAVLKVAQQIEMMKPYPTYAEAKAAVQRLGIKKQDEYWRRRKEDLRLPSNPYPKYGKDFISWGDFLRNEAKKERVELYATYAEAKAAVQRLGIKKEPEYDKRYKEDPRLPSDPDKKYGSDFISWGDFLRNEAKKEQVEPYATYEEARAAVQNLGIKSRTEYRNRYKEDPRLPSNPDDLYGKYFISWPNFLRNKSKPYATYEETRAAVQNLGIKSGTEYRKRYKEDPRLPSDPDRKYGSDFVNWGDFLGRTYHI